MDEDEFLKTTPRSLLNMSTRPASKTPQSVAHPGGQPSPRQPNALAALPSSVLGQNAVPVLSPKTTQSPAQHGAWAFQNKPAGWSRWCTVSWGDVCPAPPTCHAYLPCDGATGPICNNGVRLLQGHPQAVSPRGQRECAGEGRCPHRHSGLPCRPLAALYHERRL